jgi:hypothetical protein
LPTPTAILGIPETARSPEATKFCTLM